MLLSCRAIASGARVHGGAERTMACVYAQTPSKGGGCAHAWTIPPTRPRPGYPTGTEQDTVELAGDGGLIG